jgi:hypothetical protein
MAHCLHQSNELALISRKLHVSGCERAAEERERPIALM